MLPKDSSSYSSFINDFVEHQSKKYPLKFKSSDDDYVSADEYSNKAFYHSGASELFKYLLTDTVDTKHKGAFFTVIDNTIPYGTKHIRWQFIGMSLALTAEIEQWKKKFENVESEHLALIERFDQLQTQKEAIDIELRALRTENEKYAKDNADLRVAHSREIVALKEENKRLREDNADLRSTLKNCLRTDSEPLNQQLDNARQVILDSAEVIGEFLTKIKTVIK